MPVLPKSAIRSNKRLPNRAVLLDSSPHSQKRARAPVIVPNAVEIKLQTTLGFPWPFCRVLERPRQPTCGGSRTAETNNSRSTAFPRVPCPGARRDPAGDRPAARSQPGREDGALCPPGRRLRAAGRDPDIGQYRGRHPGRELAARRQMTIRGHGSPARLHPVLWSGQRPLFASDAGRQASAGHTVSPQSRR